MFDAEALDALPLDARRRAAVGIAGEFFRLPGATVVRGPDDLLPLLAVDFYSRARARLADPDVSLPPSAVSTPARSLLISLCRAEAAALPPKDDYRDDVSLWARLTVRAAFAAWADTACFPESTWVESWRTGLTRTVRTQGLSAVATAIVTAHATPGGVETDNRLSPQPAGV